MTEPEKSPQEQECSYVPASFEKRTAAWMGLAYAVMVLFIITFSIFTGGKDLPGTFPLFLVPVCVAVAVIAVYRQRNGTAPGGMAVTVLVLICCVLGVVIGLALGLPALLSALTDPMGCYGGMML